MPYEFRNIDLRRTFLTAGRQAFIGFVQVQQPVGYRRKADHPLGTYRDTATASTAFGRIYFRESIGAQMNRIKGANGDTGAASQATVFAAKGPTIKHGNGATILRTKIMKARPQPADAVATDNRRRSFGGRDGNTHNPGHGINYLLAAGHTDS